MKRKKIFLFILAFFLDVMVLVDQQSYICEELLNVDIATDNDIQTGINALEIVMLSKLLLYRK